MNEESGWYPVGLIGAVDPGTSAGTHVDSKEIVVWRDSSGKVHAWEDRCPHRGMKLSFGFVRGDHIACLYHGWQYDTAGQCRYIPAHPEINVPKAIKVQTYPVAERAGMIWTTLDDDPAPLPVPDGNDGTLPIRSVYFACDRGTLLAVLGDVMPAAFGQTVTEEAGLRAVSDSLYVLSTGADRLYLGIQPLSADRTALHVAVAGPADVYAGTGQMHFLDWTAVLRHRVETPVHPGAEALAETA